MSNLSHLFPEPSYSSDDEQRPKKQRKMESYDESIQFETARKSQDPQSTSSSVWVSPYTNGTRNGGNDRYGLQEERKNQNRPRLNKKDLKIQKLQQKAFNKKRKSKDMKIKYKKWKLKYKNIHKTARDLLKELDKKQDTTTYSSGMNAWGDRYV